METQGHVFPKAIADLMVKTVAKQVDLALDAAMRQLCNGCQINHPSKHQHMCLTQDKGMRVCFALNEALDMIDWGYIKEDFFEELTDSKALYLCPCFGDSMWRRELCKSDLRDMLYDILVIDE